MDGFQIDHSGMTRDIVARPGVVQFSADWCPDCQYVNSIWTKFDLLEKVFIFDIGSYSKVDQEMWRANFQEVTGSRNLPTIFVDGKIWATEKEIHDWEDNGILEDKLKIIGLLK
ncbi:glutathione-disulfide reductase GRX8 KNAG_0J02080 [Huiozyma naganishii CBS 8797]|uniref:Glutaredoxin domain-containing protein n=1 Tax=Huiozyma naganishii (strain ATCC MYA-139 / BCRC 22969 / CBS 8797 / KCTC 17520 / NBRC 10181 / NCYC 3082 / Yp74L-3) TaxID=1071383 RepID=J7S9T5_HUIN7|nr:hypothetical protein KNAG_0J02080 [Kazachstania naganishii CBS 8797]CCK72289.1 hypothetical protein KNAG_0J02080 [Kazachstania naganishii CBS 8797]